MLGFRIDPLEKLDEVVKELKNLHEIFSKSPIFGVEFTIESADATTGGADSAEGKDGQEKTPYIRTVDEDVELTDDYEDTHVVAAYYAEGTEARDEYEPILFDNSIGLAVERMQEGLTLESLWRVV